jgi:surface antigen
MATKKKNLTPSTGISFDEISSGQSSYGLDREALAQKAQVVPQTLTAKPVQLTAANGFGSGVQSPYVSELDQLSISRYKDSQKPINREAIRKQKVAEFQAQIDATNQIFTNLTAQANVQGEGRLGQQRAISARSGNLQQPRGEAQKEGVITYNNQITGDIAARQQSAISTIMTEAQNRADAEYAQKVQAKELGAQAYLQYLGQAEERKSTNAQAVLQSLLAQGLTLEDIPAEQFGQIANNLRMTPDELQNVYKGELSKAAAAQAQAEYERFKEEREFGLEESKFGFEQDKFGAEFDFNREKFNAEFGLKQDEFGFNQAKFQAEMGLKYDELNRLLNNDQLDAQVKNVEIQKKLAEINKLNDEAGISAPGQLSKRDQASFNNVNDALEAVNGLISDKGLSRAVGKTSFFNFIPGSKGADFAAKLERVKSLITLPQLEKLRGLGAMSDREFQTLTNAAAALNPKMSETAFKTELERIQKALETTKVNLEAKQFLGTPGGSEGTNPKAPLTQNFSPNISRTLASTLTQKYPEGAKGGQCGVFVRNVAKSFGLTYPALGDALKSKIAAVQKHGTSIANARIGSVLVTKENPTYGHVAWIIGKNAQGFIVAESNFKQSERVSYGRVIPFNSPKLVGVINPTKTA